MTRFLYVVARGKSARSGQLYEQLRHDMAIGPVELTFDRRRGQRRHRGETVEAQRRQDDRRRHHVEDELARVGWARVQIEDAVSQTGPPPDTL